MLNFCSKLLSGIFTLSPNTHPKRRDNDPKATSLSISTRSSRETLVDEPDTSDLQTLHEVPSRSLKRSSSHLALFSRVVYIADSRLQTQDNPRKRRRVRSNDLQRDSDLATPPLYQDLDSGTRSISGLSLPSSSRRASITSTPRQSPFSEDQVEGLTGASSLLEVTKGPVAEEVAYPTHNSVLPAKARTSLPRTSLHVSSPRTSPQSRDSQSSAAPKRPPLKPPLATDDREPNDDDYSASNERSYVEERDWSESPSPPLSSRSAPLSGESTRVEITYSKFHEELIRSTEFHTQIDEVAGRMAATPQWTSLLAAYTTTADARRLTAYSGDRKNRFLDIMNFIVDEAPICGLAAPYRHQISYGRFNYDGSALEDSPAPDQEPWQNDSRSPCIGTLEPLHKPMVSAWPCAAFLVDVYNPRNDASPWESPLSSAKRKLADDAPPSSRTTKRRRIKGIEDDDVQQFPRLSWVELEQDYYPVRKPDSGLTDSATRLFRAVGNRRHVLGIFINRMDVRFYFMDHAGTVYSTPLDLRIDAEQIISAVLSICFLDAFALGLEPYMASEMDNPPTELLQRRDDCFFEVDGVRFHAQSLIHADELFGRGTVVYEATLAPIESQFQSALDVDIPKDDVVLKLSWQLPSMRSEDEMMRLAAERGVKGVTRLYRSATVARLSDGLRGRLVSSYMYADRELRVQVLGPRAMPLYQVKDLETFKTAFRSLVVAHHDLYEKTGILHRDISPNNLMVNRSNHEEGVLIDFDLAVMIDEQGDPVDREKLAPAGTLRFRAIDLIKPGLPATSYYRHDLESFFYVLLWIQTHYTDGLECIHPEANELKFDFDAAWSATRRFKLGFLTGYGDSEPLPATSLRDSWLSPLHELFGSAVHDHALSIMGARVGRGVALDERTYGGRLTFDTFYEIVRQ